MLLKKLCFIALLFLAQLSFGQGFTIQKQIDTIQSLEPGYSRTRLLHWAMQAEAEYQLDSISILKDSLDHKLLSFEKLILASHESYKELKAGNYEKLNNFYQDKNPYNRYNSSIGFFYQGELERATALTQEVLQEFMGYDDTLFINQSLTNLGAMYWHRDHYDSALYSFLKARNYSLIFNPTLENNILAISNEIHDSALGYSQVVNLLSNKPAKGLLPPAINNIHEYYQTFLPDSLEGFKEFILNTYPQIYNVPDILLMLYLDQGWRTDSIHLRLAAQEFNNPFFQDALEALFQSKVIASSKFDQEIFNALIDINDNPSHDSTLMAFAALDSAQRLAIAKQIKATQESMERLNLTQLRYSARQLNETIDKKDSIIQKGRYAIFLLIATALLVVIIIQRRKIQVQRHSLALADDNAELMRQNTSMQTEIVKIRKNIDDLTQNTINKITGLRQAVEDLSTNPSQAKSMMNDLNVITTVEEGLMRFRLKPLVDNIQSPVFEQVGQWLNPKEMSIFKLMVLDFRSKEIALVLGVTAQHVNNMKSKIKSAIQPHIDIDFADFLVESRSEILVEI